MVSLQDLDTKRLVDNDKDSDHPNTPNFAVHKKFNNNLLFFMISVLLVSALAGGLVFALDGGKDSSKGSSPTNVPADVWLTTCSTQGDLLALLQKQEDPSSISAGSTSASKLTIQIDPDLTLQNIVGYGAGLPQSSAFVLVSLKEKNATLYWSVMHNLFDPITGAGLSFIRFPIGSCDFSMTNTSYDEVDGDYELNSWAIDPDSEYIVTVLQDAVKINPLISIMATPWSAPSWMKEWDSLLGLNERNTLINTTQIYESYANYLKKTIDTFKIEKGLVISYISLENEPLFGDNKEYPGMYLSSGDANGLGSIVKQVIGEQVNILSYDHNWDAFEYPLDNLNAQALNAQTIFNGTAWHCYAGDMATALDTLRAAYPDMPQFITECTGSFPDNECNISRGMDDFCGNHEWDMQNLFLGAAAHGSSSGVKWIMALDENCGPTLPLVSYKNGRPFISIPTDVKREDDIKFNQDFWTTMHMSKFIQPGSVRIGSTVTTSDSSNFLSESFYDIKRNVITCVTMNLDSATPLTFSVYFGSSKVILYNYVIPQRSTIIFEWDYDVFVSL